MKVVYSKTAFKAIERSNKRALLREKIGELAADTSAQSANVIKLEGRPEFRLRVQDWRVIFTIEDDVLRIIDVGPRGSIY
ncbi:MAG: type II toxin-antitoxin system RelE/ParE family toxin [Sphingomonadales bacterium]